MSVLLDEDTAPIPVPVGRHVPLVWGRRSFRLLAPHLIVGGCLVMIGGLVVFYFAW